MQTLFEPSIKFYDLGDDVEPPLFKHCKDLHFIMQLEIRYLFSITFSGGNFYIYGMPEGLEMRKTLAHRIRMQKNKNPDFVKCKLRSMYVEEKFIAGKNRINRKNIISEAASLRSSSK